ncbi:DoxX family protein [Flavobacterium sp. H122]|uniref:DoxX family protein n=1 Tax=Flavobacterium sp. H122 TaxID=2529860 RepID=UPI0010AAA62B|nr:DoxX family protein [Flavobacterium sp. H122]
MKKINLQLVVKIVLAIILLQTLFFKFTASPESVYIFTKLNAEPVGRISSGIIELIASFLLFFKRTKFYAAIVIFGTMTVALLSHLFVLGIEIMNDGGTLFLLACVCFVISGYLVFRYKNDFIKHINLFKPTRK